MSSGLLIITAFVSLGYGLWSPLFGAISSRQITLLDAIVSVINSVLLVFIILELVETTDMKPGGRHGQRLVSKLLIIGILSSVRHWLQIGIGLPSIGPKTDHQVVMLDLRELGVNAGLVLVLAAGLVCVRFAFVEPRSSEGGSGRHSGDSPCNGHCRVRI